MRVLARMVYTLAGLALIAPAGARAGLPVVAGAPWSPAQQKASSMESPPDSDGSRSNVRLCADCRRSQLMAAQQGVYVPPPPALPPGTVTKNTLCRSCGRPAAVVAGRRVPAPARPVMMANHAAPGRAVVGDEPAYAISGSDPAPIGMVQPRLAAGGSGGARDASVMPTSTASPSDPVLPMVEHNPHVLSHLFGLSAIGRDRSIARERRAEEKHARIAYGPSETPPVQSLPASAVYRR